MIPTVLSIAPFHLLHEDDQKEMQHNIFGHVMPLATISASFDVDGINAPTTSA